MRKTKITFLGDISLNNRYNTLYTNRKNPFINVRDILLNSDLVVGNLECLAEGSSGENYLKKPRLKTGLHTLNFLKELNIGLALLANNHIYDNLEDGFVRTINFLNQNSINFIGAGFDAESASKPYIKNINGINFIFLNYVTNDTNPNLPLNASIHINWFHKNKVIADIQRNKISCSKVILCLHWGGNSEGAYYPDWNQVKIANDFIDAGADLIIGSHSHTLQPFEIYRNKYIFYSLGNFCFSDIHSDGKITEIEKGRQTESCILETVYEKNNYDISIIPIENENSFIKINYNVFKKFKIRMLYFKLFKRYKFLLDMYFLKYKYLDRAIFFLNGNDRNFFKQLGSINIKKILNYLRY